jgi:hypothetical protein
MNYEEIDALVVTELKAVARALETQTSLGANLDTLHGVLTTLEYYLTVSDFSAFMATLNTSVANQINYKLQFEQPASTEIHAVAHTSSDISVNLANLGFKAYMGMAELGFVSIEQLISLASIGQATSK